jgi:hypothetical protein
MDGMLMYWHAFNALDKKDKTLTPRRREQTLHLFSGGGGFFFLVWRPSFHLGLVPGSGSG